MKGNLLLQIIIVFLIGIIIANYVYEKYKTEYVISSDNPVYFLQEGVYIDKASVRDISVPYITKKENQKYYTYLGMTLDRDIAEKIKEIYNKKGINIYIKEVDIDSNEFLSELTQYDILLKDTSNYEEITNILNTILSTYDQIYQ